MDVNYTQLSPESGDSAINQVLKAERAAHESIVRAQAETMELIVAAHEKARRINERADARVSNLRTACQRRIAQRITELQYTAEGLQCTPLEQDKRYRRLADAVARLTTALTGSAT